MLELIGLLGAASIITASLALGIALPQSLLVAGLFAGVFLPPQAGWWFWMATTFVQGEPVFSDGPSWNILGYAALAGAMLGTALRRVGRTGPRPTIEVANNARCGAQRHARLTFAPAYTYLLLVAAAYFCWASLQGWSINPGEAFGSFRRVIMFLAAALFGASIFAKDGEAGRHQFAWGMALLGAAAGALGLLEFALRRDLLIQGVDTAAALFRINGVGPNPIVYGFHLCWSLPFGLYLLAGARRWQAALLAAALVAMMAGAAVLTLNRQTMVILVAIFGLAFLLMRGRWLPWLWLAVFVAALAVTPKIAPKIIERFALVGSLEQDTSFKLRRDNFRIGMEAARAHPVTGIGLGQYPHVWLNYRPENLYYVHYIDKSRLLYLDFGYMQVTVETGLIGLALFLTLLGAGAVTALRRFALAFGAPTGTPQRDSANWWAAILLLLLMLALVSFIQDTLLRPRVWITFALIAIPAFVPAKQSVPSALKNEPPMPSGTAL